MVVPQVQQAEPRLQLQTTSKRVKIQQLHHQQQQKGPAEQLQEKESTIFKKIDLVGSSNPFVPPSFPLYSGKSDKNSEIYESFNLENTPDNFVAGKTRFFKRNWFKITHHNFIRNTICDYELEMDDLPTQNTILKPITFFPDEQDRIDQEINRFLHCKIIEKVNDSTKREYLSNIFFRPKKDGKIRIILNLKNLNKNYLEKIHFKTETLQSAIDAMRKNCYFGSVDLSEAFHSIPIREEDRKYFRFIHNNQKY